MIRLLCFQASRTVSSKPASSQATVSSEASNSDPILAMPHKLDDSKKNARTTTG